MTTTKNIAKEQLFNGMRDGFRSAGGILGSNKNNSGADEKQIDTEECSRAFEAYLWRTLGVELSSSVIQLLMSIVGFIFVKKLLNGMSLQKSLRALMSGAPPFPPAPFLTLGNRAYLFAAIPIAACATFKSEERAVLRPDLDAAVNRRYNTFWSNTPVAGLAPGHSAPYVGLSVISHFCRFITKNLQRRMLTAVLVPVVHKMISDRNSSSSDSFRKAMRVGGVLSILLPFGMTLLKLKTTEVGPVVKRKAFHVWMQEFVDWALWKEGGRGGIKVAAMMALGLSIGSSWSLITEKTSK